MSFFGIGGNNPTNNPRQNKVIFPDKTVKENGHKFNLQTESPVRPSDKKFIV